MYPLFDYPLITQCLSQVEVLVIFNVLLDKVKYWQSYEVLKIVFRNIARV